jgi:hypothetical protein
MFETLIEDMYAEGGATRATDAVTTIGSDKQKIDA